MYEFREHSCLFERYPEFDPIVQQEDVLRPNPLSRTDIDRMAGDQIILLSVRSVNSGVSATASTTSN